MNTKQRANGVMNTSLDNGKLTIKVGEQSMTFDPAKCDPALRVHAELHGWTQRIADAAAGKKSPEEKFAAMQALVEYYMSGAGEWRIKGAGRESRNAAVMAAIAAVMERDIAEVREAVEAQATRLGVKTGDVLAKLATEPKVAVELAKNAKGPEISLDDLLGD